MLACAWLTAVTAPAQVWEPGNRRIDDPEGPQFQAQWGSVITIGDFDGDGHADLAVGAPEWDQPHNGSLLEDAGGVSVWAGGPGGLESEREVWFYGGAVDRQCGYALAAGDFDGDGDDELVVSYPGDSSHGTDHGGEVRVFDKELGSWGLDSVWFQGGPIPVANEPFDQLGQSLAVGDFDFDGYADLVIGVPGENIDPPLPTALDAGAVAVIYGSPNGLSTSGVQYFHEALVGLGGAQANARFGFSLATGQFSRDLYEDLVVGIPFRDAAGATDSGQIVVLFGGADGLSIAGHQRLDDADFAGAVEAGDQFGYALAAGQFRSTGACPVLECYDELALGIPGEPIAGAAAAGGLLEIRGSMNGLNPGTAIFWTQDSLSGMSDPEAGDRLGSVLVAGELDGRDGVDLVVGVPDENWVSNSDQGMIHVVFGGAQGLVLSYPGQSRLQDGLATGPGGAGDRFGHALGVGDFDGDGTGDLAVGVPGRAVGPGDFAGTVQLLRGALFADGFQSGSTAGWSLTSP
ncbi:MAG: hypothetical protein AMXMBFR36_06350 [Acidobacteriota bacterium]